MSKRSGISFTRRAPDNITEELVAVLSSKAAFEFKPLFDIILLNLRERNAARGGVELLRLRTYEKPQRPGSHGAGNGPCTGGTKKDQRGGSRMASRRPEGKRLPRVANHRAVSPCRAKWCDNSARNRAARSDLRE